jgi:phosphatidylethanolamine-binding protein (PEBP) family uncharacterized protein
VHWVVWNIPPAVTELREGLESLDRLEDPMGLRQGPNTATTIISRFSRWIRDWIFVS